MTLLFEDLTSYEREELVAALRRDMRRQQDLSLSSTSMAAWHGYNARNIMRILECINPKSASSQSTAASETIANAPQREVLSLTLGEISYDTAT